MVTDNTVPASQSHCKTNSDLVWPSNVYNTASHSWREARKSILQPPLEVGLSNFPVAFSFQKPD